MCALMCVCVCETVKKHLQADGGVGRGGDNNCGWNLLTFCMMSFLDAVCAPVVL